MVLYNFLLHQKKKTKTGGILAEEMFVLVNGVSVSTKPFKFNLFFFFLVSSIIIISVGFF